MSSLTAMSSLTEWLKEMVGKEVEVEMDDNEFQGTLCDVTDEPMLSVKLSNVTDADDDSLGITVISWRSGYRISLIDEETDY